MTLQEDNVWKSSNSSMQIQGTFIIICIYYRKQEKQGRHDLQSMGE